MYIKGGNYDNNDGRAARSIPKRETQAWEILGMEMK
jgi:hypothetical protein